MPMDSIDLRPEDLWGSGDEDGEEDDLERELHRLEHGDRADEAEEAPARAESPTDAEAVDADALSSLKKLRAAEVSTRRVSRPRPKLDPLRLMSDRGLTELVTMVGRHKWRGKGHEAKDLAKLMATYEHWGHLLFPKMRFEEITEKLEALGHKKAVQAIVTKIRLDMPLGSGTTNVGPPPNHTMSDEEPPVETGVLTRGFDDSWEATRDPQPDSPEAATAPRPASPPPPTPPSQVTPSSPALSQEQQQRIAANREKALALRRQRLSTQTA